MKLAPAALLAAFAFTGLAFGVGCASGEKQSDPLTTQPSPIGNPNNSEYGDDDDGTTVLGARPDPKSTTPIGFATAATGDDDDSASSDTDGGVRARDGGGASTTSSSSGGTSSSSSSSSSGGTSSSSSSGGKGSSSSSSSSSSGGSTSSSSSGGSTSSSSSGGTTTGVAAACKATTVCGTDSSTTDLGYVSGDYGADVVTASGTTSHFFKVIIGEDTTAGIPLWMTATLTSPAGANYDLYVYTQSCATPTKSSKSTTSNDVTQISIPASVGDSYAVIEVRAVNSQCTSTDKWSLKVEGNK